MKASIVQYEGLFSSKYFAKMYDYCVIRCIDPICNLDTIVHDSLMCSVVHALCRVVH